nr:hypothetical protein [Tanacetum cinerariifolium]
MVAYLKKPKGSEGFHRIVDFLNASHIRYALTENPTIYVSHIEQFWRTANVRTLDNGEQELTGTIDGKVKTVTEASVRRHLKLTDDDETTLFPSMLVQDQTSQGEGPTSPVETQHTPTVLESSSQLQTVSITYRKTRTRIRRMSFRIPQSNVHTNVEDKVITMKMHDSLKRAATTATSLEAVQDSGIINKTPSKATPSGLSSPRSSSEGGLGYHVTMRGYSCSELHRRKLRLVLSDDEEDPSKQGRMIDQLDQDETINLINATQVSDQGEAYDQVSTASTVFTTISTQAASQRKGEIIMTEEEERKQSKKKQKTACTNSNGFRICCSSSSSVRER